MTKYSELYKLDSKGKLRVYFIEQEGDKYRMVTGIFGGALVTSKWTVARPKNIGKANETTGEQQAVLEVDARYTKKRDEGYYDTVKEAEDNPEGRFFEPMLAETWEKVTDAYRVFPLIADPKLDGMRLTVYKDDAISRRGNPVPTAAHIVLALKPVFGEYPTVRFDGELYNHELKNDFEKLMSIARKEKPAKYDLDIAKEMLQFHIYDCYDYSNPGMTAAERKTLLKIIAADLKTDCIKFVLGVTVNNMDELEKVKEQNLIDGYEGTITRGPKSIYECKRSRWLLKHKDFITEEFKVESILAGKGNRSGIAGTVVVIVDGKSVGCGLRGSHEYAKTLLQKQEEFIGKLATVRYFGKTEDGSLRFPVCIDIDRPDL